MITRSTFSNNSGNGISRYSFRANTGAVAIGFNNIVSNRWLGPQILISHCNFTKNRATAKYSFRTTHSAFNDQIFTGRGGGLGFFINESRLDITAMVYDNIFVGNYGRSFGGGLYMVIFGEGAQNTFLLRNNVFEENQALLGGGALIMSFFSSGDLDNPHTINITNSSFLGNSGESGGAISIYIPGGGKFIN